MRLINVETFAFEEFYGDHVPLYAILSHTWGLDETTFQDFQTGRAAQKRGFDKVKHTCAQAARHGLEWAWVDTCCIDKTNSTELSEAINSMFRYYAEAKYCYVYLEDVPPEAGDMASEEDQDFLARFEKARWFTRGWTLQELVAPSCHFFFGTGWQLLGLVGIMTAHPNLPEGEHPVGRNLIDSVSNTTGIPIECLYHERQPSTFTVAVRMSWAATRACTRLEDTAYSLMGLFDVNMPLLYGEGPKAFIRLQEEILRDTDDHTLLAWTVPRPLAGDDGDDDFTPMGVLAPAPSYFRGIPAQLHHVRRETHLLSQMTKHGLNIQLPLQTRKYGLLSHLYARDPVLPGSPSLPQIVDAYLRCGRREYESVVIRLLHVPRDVAGRENLYYRIGTSRLGFVGHRAEDKEALANPFQPGEDSGSLRTSDRVIYVAKKLLPMKALAGFDPSRIHFHYQTLPRSVVDDPRAFTALDRYPDYKIPGWVAMADSAGPGSFMLHLPPPVASYGGGGALCIDVSFTRTHVGIRIRHSLLEDAGPLFWEPGYMRPIYEPVAAAAALDDDDEKRRFASQQDGAVYDYDNDSTRKKRNIPKYGVVAQDEAVIAGHFVAAQLWREDPRTEEGEAAGCRKHFLILVDIGMLRLSDEGA